MIHFHGGHGWLRTLAGVFVAVCAVTYVVVYPANAFMLVARVVMMFVELANNFATGRYQ